MRRKKEAVLAFEFNNDDLPKIVREHRAKYKRISQILDENSQILDLVHEDLKKLAEKNEKQREGKKMGGKGRFGDFTSETILRTLVVHAIGGDSLRETVIRIAESDFLQDFLRTRKKAVMDYSFLDKCFKVIQPDTWKQINEVLVRQAVAREAADPSTIRVDTTAVETNVHWPTDASLLWDTYRVAARLMRGGREVLMASCPYRFHDRKIRRLSLFITRYSASKSKKRLRKVKQAFGTLIERVGQIVEKAGHFCEFAEKHGHLDLLLVAAELKAFLPSMTKVVDQARRAQLDGEKVPAAERVFSIFEPHTELIRRGRRSKPTEFGHMVLLCQSPEKLITDYDVMEHRVADCKLTETVIDRHEQLFGQAPEVLAGDKGFCPAADEYEELEERVETLAIPRRMRDFANAVMSQWQAFRAGIEGTISGLKRAFRLARCFYRGFKSFATSIGLAVFSHNLVVLARSGGT
jgi:IS5 family transposase